MPAKTRWINIDKRSNKLVVRFKVRGYSKQFFISSGLEDSPQNRELIQLKINQIQADIKLERFDATLKSYQFNPFRYSQQPPQSQNKKHYSLDELWQKFTEFKRRLLEPTTIKIKYDSVARYIDKLPNKNLNKAPQIRDYLLSSTTHYMAWELINRFSECCGWAVDSGLIDSNPFEKLKIKKPRKSSLEVEDYRAFTLEQRDWIISAFESHPQHGHYADLVKFLFWTGCRPGEAFALTWGDISEECTRINIDKSCNLLKLRKGTKNAKRRVFPTSQGSKLQRLLLGRQPQPEKLNAASLVFVTKTGQPITSTTFQACWHKRTRIYNGQRRDVPGVVLELFTMGKVPYLSPYAMRHTWATWAIASGVTPEKVALWLGDEVATILKFYCHPNVVVAECPDF